MVFSFSEDSTGAGEYVISQLTALATNYANMQLPIWFCRGGWLASSLLLTFTLKYFHKLNPMLKEVAYFTHIICLTSTSAVYFFSCSLQLWEAAVPAACLLSVATGSCSLCLAAKSLTRLERWSISFPLVFGNTSCDGLRSGLRCQSGYVAGIHYLYFLANWWARKEAG